MVTGREIWCNYSSTSPPPLPSLTSPPQQEDYELVIDDQIAFVMAERVAGHREEEEVGGAAVLHFCPDCLSCGVVQRM